MTTQELKDISMDTLYLLAQDYYTVNGMTYPIKQYVMNSLQNTKMLGENDKILINPNRKTFQHTDFFVVNQTTTSTIQDIYKNNNNSIISVLNFASAIKAGGGWLNGKVAQEEDIMRKTTAFPSLVIQNEYYKNHDINSPLFSDRIIYTPNVAVIKDDNFNLIEPCFIDLYTCAAVDKASALKNVLTVKQMLNYCTANGFTKNLIFETMFQRISKLLLYMVSNNAEIAVLGAFGCGVFGNSAEDVATIFKKILINLNIQRYFKSIYFAVYDTSANQDNFNIFKKVFN